MDKIISNAIAVLCNQYGIAFIFTVLDYISGTVQSIANSTFASSVMRKGIFHKMALWLVLVTVAVFDWSMAYVDLAPISKLPISGCACAFITVMEIGSIMENLHKANAEIPGSIADIINRHSESGGE